MYIVARGDHTHTQLRKDLITQLSISYVECITLAKTQVSVSELHSDTPTGESDLAVER